MNPIIVQYKVKADKAQQNIDYINAVFEALKEAQPAGVRYASFQLEDGVSFIHIASIETDDGTNPLANLDAFNAFTKDISDRCEVAPVANKANLIDSYQLFS